MSNTTLKPEGKPATIETRPIGDTDMLSCHANAESIKSIYVQTRHGLLNIYVTDDQIEVTTWADVPLAVRNWAEMSPAVILPPKKG